MRGALALLGFGLGLPALAAAAATDTPVRVGDHPGFGRIVFDLPGRAVYHLFRNGDRITLRFGDAGQVLPAPRLPRNVREIANGESSAEIAVAPGARLRTMRLGSRLVIDVLDPTSSPPSSAPKPPVATREAVAGREPNPVSPQAEPVKLPAGAAPGRPVEAEREHGVGGPTATPGGPKQAEAMGRAETNQQPVPPLVLDSATRSPGPEREKSAQADRKVTDAQSAAKPQQEDHAAPAVPMPAATLPAAAQPDRAAPMLAQAVDPLALMAKRVPPPPETEGSAILLPFGREAGAAAFPHGSEALVVFDARRPIDLGALRDDPVFGTAAIQLLPEATILRMKLPAGQKLGLDHTAAGWTLVVSARDVPITPIEPEQDGATLALPAQEPGHVVVVPDPGTGENLLIGTQRKSGQGIPVRRRGPFFALGHTWQGVLVEPVSDRLELRPLPDRFVLSAKGLALDLPGQAAGQVAAGAAALTRRFDLPDLPEAALRRRLQLQTDAAALAPPLSRFAPRYALAETMVALGMGVEAEALLHLAMAEDPQHVADPDAVGLAAIAALLAGRDAESTGLEDQRLNGTDEIALWRAIRTARRPAGAAQAAPVLAATWPLLLSYPAPLRARLLPLAAEAMVKGGAVQAAADLLKRRPADPGLAFARALLLEKTGNMAGAIQAFDALAAGPDRLLRARAARRAVEMRLAAGQLDAASAAGALEKLLLAWRGDERERHLRLRIAGLRAQARQWRTALDLLRETEALFPDQRQEIHSARADAFAAMLKDRQHVSPLDLVMLAEENADVAPNGPAGDDLAAVLADRLVQLDLPRRAGALLDRLMRAAPPGPARAAYGARLAQLRLEDGDAAGALTALTDSDASDLPPEVQERRALLAAHGWLREQHPDRALATLAGLDSAAADDLRAAILAEAKDWPGAVSALKDLAAKSVPPEGRLTDDQQRILLRLASAAAEAGDDSVLRSLRQQETARMQKPELAGMFRLLTGGSVRRLSELPLVASDIAMARALPADLRALSAPQPARDPVMQ